MRVYISASQRMIYLAITCIICALLLSGHHSRLIAAPMGQEQSGPDLVAVGINLNPDELIAGSEISFTAIIENQGDQSSIVGSIQLYIDPVDDPPTLTTINDIPPLGDFVSQIAPGDTYLGATWTREVDVDEPQVCFIVDATNQVAESNEDNNVFCLKQPPQEQPEPDAYDSVDNVDDDDVCANASLFTVDGAPQSHNLSRTNDQADEDWIKFDATSGVEYTVEAIPNGDDGADAEIFMSLLPDCDTPGFGNDVQIKFTAPESKTYYVQLGHNQSEYGPKTAYNVTVTANTECSDLFEPNDTCTLPVDFPLSTGTQAHSFCKANDVDWIRFEVKAGGKYKVSTQNVGDNADPALSIFPSCDSGGLPGQTLEITAPTAGYYYMKVENRNNALSGVGTDYSVNIDVLSQGCELDNYETDNSSSEAQALLIDSNAQTHNICPKADQDWVEIQTTIGTTFTVETLDLGPDSDTYLCIYDRSGNKLNCDRDSGAGLGSRVIMNNVDDEIYYARVTDENEEVAGESTQYKLRAITTIPEDAQEPDDSREQAKPTQIDGTPQQHNIHTPDDNDWVKFTVDGNTTYTFKAEQMGDEGDTELALYDSNENLLARNDDFSTDASSRIVYTFDQGGEYFLRVRLYNPIHFGAGTEYALTIQRGEPDAPPPSEPDPPGPPPSTPPPSATDVRTLILVNAERLNTLHGNADTTALLAKLDDLAGHEKVLGEVIQLNRNEAVSTAYMNWTGTTDDYKSVEKANLVADAIRRLIMTYLSERSGVKYIVLVGDDRVVPLRRVVDATPQLSEKTYTYVNDKHPSGAAILQDYFLTDDFYVDSEPIPHKGREIYIPDPNMAIGRLVETPTDMINMIDIFLNEPITEVNGVLVSGYDFVQDTASSDCVNWRKAFGDDGTDDKVDCVIGSNWTKNDLFSAQVQSSNPYKIQSINGHAEHFAEGTPDLLNIEAAEIYSETFDMSGGLVYTLACHAGLNVPEENETHTIDLPQSFIKKGSNYIGNTGYGWGYRGAIGLSEQMMQFFTPELIKGQPMGLALSSAKQQYYRLTQARTGYDEKVMQQFVFYGLPMFEIAIQGQDTLGNDDPFAGLVGDDFIPSLSSDAQFTQTVSFQFTNQINPNEEILELNTDQDNDGNNNTFGNYQSLADYSYAELGQPVQPLYFKDVTQASSQVRSVVIRSGDIKTAVLNNFDPIIATPDNEFVTPEESQISGLATVNDESIQPAWYPPRIVGVQDLDGVSTLSTQLGQFNPATNEQRNFENLQVDIYYSLSSDLEGPTFTLVDGLVTPNCDGSDGTPKEVIVKVGVQDESGIQEVTLQYFTDGLSATSALESSKLTFDASSQKWTGKFPGDCNSRFQISAMDKAFNRTLANNKGERFAPVPARLEERSNNNSASTRMYLPLIQSNQ